MTNNREAEDLQRIQDALDSACTIFARFTPGAIAAEFKGGNDPVTEVDRLVDVTLRDQLARDSEGWLSEETVDDLSRLEKHRVWIVDPLDGTREFVSGIAEFCVSVALVENGLPVAAGVCNPATREFFLGSIGSGVLYNGRPAKPRETNSLKSALVLASRSEVERGAWERFAGQGFRIQPMGSVAYKLARVAAGLADATFTLYPKHEWDVAGGAALVHSGGGFVATLEGAALRCNNRDPLLSGLFACAPLLRDNLGELLSKYRPSHNAGCR